MKKKNKKDTLSCRIQLPPQGCPDLFPPNICINPVIQLEELGVISCEATIRGRVLCDNAPVEGVQVTLTSSFPELMFSDPTPVTDRRGIFTTTVTVPRGTPITADVRITATATVSDQTISDSITVRAGCVRCDNPVLTLNPIEGPVGCQGTQISGRLLCDGLPVPNAAVSFTIGNDSTKVTIAPNPAITNADGTFTATLVPFLGIDATITVTANAIVGGHPVTSETQSVTVVCLPCQNPVIILDDLDPVVCDGVVTGRVLCDGRPVPGVQVRLSSPLLVFASPTVTTNGNGEFSGRFSVPPGTSEQVTTYTARAEVNGISVSETNSVEVSCPPCQNPIIQLDNAGPISCSGPVTGRVLCDGAPVPGVQVTLSSPLLSFQPSVVTTNINGEFSSTASVPFPTQITTGVPYTASATVNGIPVSNTNFLRAGCVDCPNPAMNLIVPPSIQCDGTLMGRVVCNGTTPIPNVPVFFDIVQSHTNVFINPDPAITGADGRYTATIMGVAGTMETVTVTARATVGGIPISAGPFSVRINCPPPPACPCKFKLDTQGGAQPGAQIRVTRYDNNVTNYTGTLNVTINECGASKNGPCNPAVDNFNFVFNAGNGDNFQFTQGRRTMISCENNFTVAIVEGMINGKINNGPSRTFDARIRATLNNVTGEITYEIFATDNTTTTFETIVPFTAAGSPQSFITGC
ncbi:carboxypeptidase-like regulatory domain-containing protein [Rossellomorea vietnamensis]|uniref:carboxypeptidase-like regulatory domain-containing protein n=1 Tax=Rossellomorea vietnamensis TaxID=218284 RepID=UPI00054D73F1|nr:carboxypeptidase-like regulatory domain-containing protein [Rossellomorea vietnamensis]OXS63889.1 hypothetical protein B1B00_04080 [Bacillus sp. DSM 27956]PRX78979.1 hypothetical protein B0G93_102342 [Bacillus sp. V-88]SLK16382.1 hypothetical protein SAMN06295884_102342 [Bacillus sp. V-88]